MNNVKTTEQYLVDFKEKFLRKKASQFMLEPPAWLSNLWGTEGWTVLDYPYSGLVVMSLPMRLGAETIEFGVFGTYYEGDVTWYLFDDVATATNYADAYVLSCWQSENQPILYRRKLHDPCDWTPDTMPNWAKGPYQGGTP